MEYTESVLREEKGSILAGKRAICFGDSITWYDGHIYNWGKEAGRTAKGYESYLRAEGMCVKNAGIDGATIREILAAVQTSNINEYDYVFISSGANDSRYNIPTGCIQTEDKVFNTETFIGCLQTMIDEIWNQNQKAEIVLMTPIKGWIYAPLGYAYSKIEDGVVEERFADAIQKVGAFYKCTVCDWYHRVGIDESSRAWMINDPEPDCSQTVNPNPFYSLHPSTEGYRRMSALLLCSLRQNEEK